MTTILDLDIEKKIKGLNFYGNFHGNLGIPIHSLNLAKAFQKLLGNQKLNLIQLMSTDLLRPIDDNLKPSMKTFGNPEFDNLIFWYPNLFHKLPGEGKTYGYYIFEYTIIPKDFVNKINELDGVCTASDWGCKVLKDNGVIVPIYKFPGGVDSDFYCPDYSRLNNDKIKLLHVGKKEVRKGTEPLLKYLKDLSKEYFSSYENWCKYIELSLLIDNPHDRDFNAEAFIYQIFGEIPSWINILHDVEDMRDLYQTHHIGIFPSFAEGIGLPITEALASGMIVVAQKYSGTEEYLNDNTACLLTRGIEEPIFDPLFFPNKGEFGVWKNPTDLSIIEYVMDMHPITAEGPWSYHKIPAKDFILFLSERKSQARESMIPFSWERAAKIFIKDVLIKNAK